MRNANPSDTKDAGDMKWVPVVAVLALVGVVWFVGDRSGRAGDRFSGQPQHLLALLLGAGAVVAACMGAFSAGGAWSLRAAGVLALAAACLLSPESWGAPMALGLAVGLPALGAALRGRADDRDASA